MSLVRIALPALVLPLLWAPTATEAAAADTCFGQAPTIVGAPGQRTVRGTEGPDVILTTDADRIRALGGDDLVCVVGEHGRYIDAGSGDDAVSTQSNDNLTRTRLGSGADTFLGGRGFDEVDAGDRADTEAGLAPSIDHISTGGGRDEVITGATGESTDPNTDVLTLGPGGDSVTVRGRAVPSIDGGGGWNSLTFVSETGGSWSLDTSTSKVSIDGVAMGPLARVQGVRLYRAQWDELHFVGSRADEELDLGQEQGKVGHDGPISIDMRGGDDDVWTRSQDRGTVTGGAGKDWLRVEAEGTTSRRTPLFADLQKGFVRMKGSPGLSLEGWERTWFNEANFSTILATQRRDNLVVWGCGNTIRGRGGDDEIIGYECDQGPKVGVRIEGGPGNDYLTGSLYRDRLLGGPGRDRADGRGGGDRCAVEIKGYGC